MWMGLVCQGNFENLKDYECLTLKFHILLHYHNKAVSDYRTVYLYFDSIL